MLKVEDLNNPSQAFYCLPTGRQKQHNAQFLSNYAIYEHFVVNLPEVVSLWYQWGIKLFRQQHQQYLLL